MPTRNFQRYGQNRTYTNQVVTNPNDTVGTGLQKASGTASKKPITTTYTGLNPNDTIANGLQYAKNTTPTNSVSSGITPRKPTGVGIGGSKGIPQPTVDLRTYPDTTPGISAAIGYIEKNGLPDTNSGNKGGGNGGSKAGGGSSYYPGSYYPDYGTTYPAVATPERPNSDDFINEYLEKMQGILEQNRTERENAAEERYKNLISDADNNYNRARDQVTLDNAMTQKWLKENYGGELTGNGLTNQLRARTNMNNNLADVLRDRATAYGNAREVKENDIAEAGKSYADNYANFASILQNAKLGNDQAMWQAELSNYLKQQQNNMDYDYRKFLAQLGL